MKKDKFWTEKSLGEICEVIAGQSPEGKYYNSLGKGIPFYQGKKDFGIKYIKSPRVWTSQITKEALKDDILMSVRAPVGPVNFANEHICIGRGLAAIRTKKEIDKEFLFLFLSKSQNLISGSAGAVFDSINKKQIEEIKIKLPNLVEQKRIVKILDKAFEDIDKAKEKIEKNIQNTKSIFSEKLRSFFILQENWNNKKIYEVCEVVNGGTPKTNISKFWNGEINWLTPAEMGNKNIIYLNETERKISQNGLERSSAKLVPPFSVILSSRAPIGYLKVNSKEMSFNQGCKGIVPKQEIYYKYLYYYLFSNVSTLQSLGTGATFKELSSNSLKNFHIVYPKDLNLQKKISRILDKLSEQTKKLEAIYQKKLDNLEELKKSFLKKAFNGEL